MSEQPKYDPTDPIQLPFAQDGTVKIATPTTETVGDPRQNRPQLDPTKSQPAVPPNYGASRPQTAGAVEQRVNPGSIPSGGTVTRAEPGAASRANGAVGVTAPRSPFKNMR